MPPRTLHLTGEPEADALLAEDPLALLIGMVLDQQVPLERAFAAPALLAERLGGPLDAAAIAAMDPGRLSEVFAERPALHRFPGSMAARVQSVCQVVTDRYRGDAANVWRDAVDGRALLAAVKALPGFGEQKARIFVALLGKQFDVRPDGWTEASTPYGEPGSYRSVADIVDADSLARVRATKQAAKQAAKASKAVGTAEAPKRPGRAATRS